MKSAVLIVDDSQFFRDALAAALADSGLEVIMAKNGKEALELLAQSSNVGAMVLDVSMPILNGKEVLAQLGDHSLFIVATGHASEQQALHECRQLGVDDVLTKPVDVEALGLRLRQRVEDG